LPGTRFGVHGHATKGMSEYKDLPIFIVPDQSRQNCEASEAPGGPATPDRPARA
jgi:hypothetical protein